ncbi:MAG: hypothetical protein M1833_001594 [Piccolia ochrophora]|nr:MAG: hypothetical protein M1833_001594 [Piccolia ochrophora]
MGPPTGASIIAHALHDLGVQVIFGIVGIPVVEIAEEAINLGIRFLAFRNEQAASYAASAYGYITGQPGVCLVVGGPGVLHAMAGIGNSSANAWPLLLLAGSSETDQVTKGAFQELDAIALLAPHTKLAVRPPSLESIPECIRSAHRNAWYGRPGTGFVDLPADLIQGVVESTDGVKAAQQLAPPPNARADEDLVAAAVKLLQNAKAPLVVIGKGAAYAQAEGVIREFIDTTGIHFLPTPMGKGVVPDSHPLNTASARSTALAHADVVLVLGARLNWILHFGEPPKWNPAARFIQVDISAEEIGRNTSSTSLGLVGDLKQVTAQLLRHIRPFRYDPSSSPYASLLSASRTKNETTAARVAANDAIPMTLSHALTTIKNTLHSLSPPSAGATVYVSEGANTMDTSRSIFPVEQPRLRLDAGTHATMGVGLGYAIAAHAAYNPPSSSSSPSSTNSPHKKIIAIEGDSAFGFSGLELETMARARMDILIFVLNNSGVYHGEDAASADEWAAKQAHAAGPEALRSTSLGWEVRYEKLAEMCGGVGFFVREPAELEDAVRKAWLVRDRPVVVNVVVEKGKGGKLEFGWQGKGKKKEGKEEAKL